MLAKAYIVTGLSRASDMVAKFISDNHVVELAVAGAAGWIVTRNLRDLSAMELRFPGLRVVSPEDFLKEL